jgi:nucleoside-diphosphate-sugar epimerase
MADLGRIAVAGAGSLGTPIIQALVRAGFPVTVLTRSSQMKSLDLDPSADVKFAMVDYASSSSLEDALQGHFGVVSTVNARATGEQMPLIEAAVRAGVERFIPAEFGADMANKKARALPVFEQKEKTAEKLSEMATTNPNFTYTLVRNGVFFDWGLQMNFLLNTQSHTATIIDGGDHPFSTTTLATVAKAVVDTFQHLKETKNWAVYIHDAVLTQNQLIDIVKRVGSNKAEWTLERTTTAEVEKRALKSPAEDAFKAMMDQLCLSIYAEGYGGNFSGRTDNALFGISEMTKEEIQNVAARYV